VPLLPAAVAGVMYQMELFKVVEVLQSIEASKVIEIFFATFVGVWSAFQLERQNKNRDSKQKDFVKFVEAQGCLQMQKQIISVIYREIMPLKEESQRTGMVGPIIINPLGSYIDLKGLSFMLGENNLLAMNIIVLQSNVRSALDGLAERNELHKIIQKSVHTSFQGGDAKKVYDINYKLLDDMTNDLYRDIESLNERIDILYNEFESYGMSIFPKTKPTKMKVLT